MEKTWWKEAAVYQVYPRSFKDSNGDGIGDLQGIIEKLSYIKELGIDVIWLCPVYQSPNKDNGYDISDYQDIMSDFGTMQDFEELLEKAHAIGLKIIMDLVVNHTSDQHAWFIESKKSKDNPYRDYYIWRDGKDDLPPNQQQSVFEGSAWQYDNITDMYYLHLYTKEQPDLNWENEIVRDKIYTMMTWWLDKGIDGFRMDVINQISKDFKRMDNTFKGDPEMYSIISNGPRVHEFLQEMHQKVLSNYDTMTVGETADVSVEDALLYSGFDRNELRMIFQFEHMSLDKGPNLSYKRPNLKELKEILNRWQVGLDGKAWNALYWDNHDRPRAVSKYGDDSSPFYLEKSAKMLALFMFWMQGTPYIYQGEEIGMTNAYYTSMDQYRDIDTLNKYQVFKEQYDKDTIIKYFGKRSRDNARAPMQWNSDVNAGFSESKPWIDVCSNYQTINVEKALQDNNSIYYFYQKILTLRKQYPTIIYGSYQQLLQDHPSIYCYQREYQGQAIIVICNYDKEQVVIDLEIKGTLLISNYEDDLQNTLRSYEAKAYIL